MRLARYIEGGRVEIADAPDPTCPPGGLLVATEACGLCSGELMDWYMDRKVPHVLGHEVCGRVLESQDPRFVVGDRVFPHHHAPCMACRFCLRADYVHCPTWKSSKLDPGGMAERFAVPAENLTDTHIVNDLRPVDAALIEPLACVMKCLRRSGARPGDSTAVIGLGALGVMHALMLPGCIAYELSAERRAWAAKHGIDARPVDELHAAQRVFVCPGSESALRLALQIVEPGGTVCLFAPMHPGTLEVDLESLYFRDLTLVNSYSCGPDDTTAALEVLRLGTIQAEQIVSDFINLDELPESYQRMKSGEILKAMVVFE